MQKISKAIGAGVGAAAGTTYLTLPDGFEGADLVVLAVNFGIGFAFAYFFPANKAA